MATVPWNNDPSVAKGLRLLSMLLTPRFLLGSTKTKCPLLTLEASSFQVFQRMINYKEVFCCTLLIPTGGVLGTSYILGLSPTLTLF